MTRSTHFHAALACLALLLIGFAGAAWRLN